MQYPKRKRSTECQTWNMVQERQWNGLRIVLRDESNVLAITKRRHLAEAKARIPLLSFAIWQGAPLVIVEKFITRFPESLAVTDSLGRFPLHLACIQRRCPAIIDLLLQHDNNHLTLAQDHKGNTPLHYAVIAACECAESDTLDCHLDVVTSLLVARPDLAVLHNNLRETPLSLSKQLDRCGDRVLYNMLVKSNKTLNRRSSPRRSRFASDELTLPSSSFLLDRDVCVAVQVEDETEIDWDNTERQAKGERPKRRNGIIIKVDTGFDLP